jgi:hypothetical protein
MKKDKDQLSNFIKNKNMLKILASSYTKPRYKQVILKNADQSLINAISDSTRLLLEGKINLSDTDRNILKKYKNIIRKIANKSTPLSKKRNIISSSNQRGGFLEFLIPALITGISSIVASAVG